MYFILTFIHHTAGLHTSGGSAFANIGSCISTYNKFTTSFSYVEAIAKQPLLNFQTSAQFPLWPAWWLDGAEWPADWEIDVLEGLGTDSGCMWHCHNPSGGPGGQSTVTGATSGMHAYAAHIQPAQVSSTIFFIYDGAG